MNMSTVTKIVIFGSTGQTGLCCVDAAIKKGLNVTAFVRDPSRLPNEYSGKVTVFKGDATNKSDVEKAVDGNDGVVVALGTRNDLNATTVMSDSLKIIVEAMRNKGVKKISVCLSAFLFWDLARVPPRFLEVNADHQRMLDILNSTECADLDWVAVLPPHIADEPSSNGQFVVKHGMSPGRKISKWDLGQFLIDCLGQPEHKHQRCGLADPSPSQPTH